MKVLCGDVMINFTTWHEKSNVLKDSVKSQNGYEIEKKEREFFNIKSEYWALILGITRRSLDMKLSGIYDFKFCEILIIKNLLDVSDDDIILERRRLLLERGKEVK